MKKFFLLFCVGVLTVISACCSNEIPQPLKMEKNGVLIDVRTPREYKTNHIKGAINIPYDEVDPNISRSVPEKNTPIYLYCRSGRRSSIAMKKIREMGYTTVHDLGGFQDAKKKLLIQGNQGKK